MLRKLCFKLVIKARSKTIIKPRDKGIVKLGFKVTIKARNKTIIKPTDKPMVTPHLK